MSAPTLFSELFFASTNRIVRCCVVPTGNCSATELGESAKEMPPVVMDTAMPTLVPPPDTVTVPLYVLGGKRVAFTVMVRVPLLLPPNGFGETLALNQFPPPFVLADT